MLAFLIFICHVYAGILKVDILDVGQGDAILITSPEGKTILIDGGTGSVDVVEYLKDRSISEINLVIASHAHADHIGGLDEVVDAFPIKLFVDNGMSHTTRTYNRLMQIIEEKEVSYLTAKNGQIFNLGNEVTLEIIHPQDKLLKNTRSDLNSNSVVIRMEHGNNCFLFTGDAEEPTENILIQKGIKPCQVLKVAHHGSNHSSTERFLREVQPKIALISLGENNRYNHPGDETIARLEKVGATIYRTDTMGTITLESDGENITIQNTKDVSVDNTKDNSFKSEEDEISITLERSEAPINLNIDRHNIEISDNNNIEKEETTENVNSSKKNINTAEASELEMVPGIGPKRSQAIIQYRVDNGPFSSLNDVQNVHGIGPKTVVTLHEYFFAE
jgi:competence protein ComEC